MSHLHVLRSYFDAVAWTPASLPNLVAWYDASDAASITSSGGAVSQWNDKSGNGHHLTQSTSNLKPTTGTRTLNGLNVIDFDGAVGSADYMDSNALNITQPNTIFAVVRHDNVSGNRGTVTEGTASGHRHLLYVTGVGRTWGFYAGSGITSAVTPDTTTAHALIAVANSTSSELWLDGTSIASGNAGTNDLGTLRVGQDRLLTSDGGLDGFIAELIICNTALDSTNRGLLVAYSQSKWATP